MSEPSPCDASDGLPAVIEVQKPPPLIAAASFLCCFAI